MKIASDTLPPLIATLPVAALLMLRSCHARAVAIDHAAILMFFATEPNIFQAGRACRTPRRPAR